MKKTILLAAMTAGMIPAMAGVRVNVNPEMNLDSLEIRGVLFTDMINATRENPPKIDFQKVAVKNGEAEFNLPIAGFSQYQIAVGPQNVVDIYAVPQDNILVQITSPQDFAVKGTQLMDDITAIKLQMLPIEKEYTALMESGKATKEGVMALAARFEQVAEQFVKTSPDSPAAAYAMLEIEGNSFLDLYPAMTEASKQSPFYPLVEKKALQVAQQLEKEKKVKEMTTGDYDAPAFTLENLERKQVSLSDFRGKWVVLDFWGSWCKWCIKGFPELKEAYAKYKGKLEIIGIDNRDTKDQWRDAVKRFDLPWVQLYNPKETAEALLAKYMVEGFPTKVIVSPQGKIMDITVGEDPSFFDRLADFLK